MRTRRIRFAGGTNRWARDLYLRAFPEDERIPWALIHVLSLRRGVDLVAWWDQPAGSTRAARPDPVALTWTVRRPGSRLLFLFYLAVDDAARGRGVGVGAAPAAARRGDQVRGGGRLGTLEATGGHCGAAPCLHLGARRGRDYVDPLPLLTGGPIVLLPVSP